MTPPGTARRAENGGPPPPEQPRPPEVHVPPSRIARLFRHYRPRLAILLCLIVLSAGIGVVSPFLLRAVLDTAIPQKDTTLLTLLVLGMVGSSVASGAIGVAQTWLSNSVGQRVMHDLRSAVYAHLQRMSLAFFTRTHTGEVQSRIANDIGGIDNVVTSTATSIMSNVTTVLATLVAMVALDWRLAVFSLALLPFFLWLTRKVGQERKRITSVRQSRLADMSTLVEESLSVSGIVLGKTMGRGPELARRFTDESAELADIEVHSRMAGRWRMASVQMSFAIMPALVYWFAGWSIANGGEAHFLRPVGGFTTPPTRPLLPVASLVPVGLRGATTHGSVAAPVALASEAAYLCHPTSGDNLGCASPDATDEEIGSAARAAQIHERIASLPDGYETMVGERGYRFSGGEKQRIAIARTVLR